MHFKAKQTGIVNFTHELWSVTINNFVAITWNTHTHTSQLAHSVCVFHETVANLLVVNDIDNPGKISSSLASAELYVALTSAFDLGPDH